MASASRPLTIDRTHATTNHTELREVKLTKEEEDVVIGQLHTVLRPFLLRRTKTQVGKEEEAPIIVALV